MYSIKYVVPGNMKETSVHFTSAGMMLEYISEKLYIPEILSIKIVKDESGYEVTFTYMS